MNIFYLHSDVKLCAQMHNNKHCVKMVLEYSQILSTAHRLCDGTETIGLSKSGRKAKRWILNDSREEFIYSATHINHPSTVWARQSKEIYMWLGSLLKELCKEYTYRYGKVHKIEQTGLMQFLSTTPPIKIPISKFTEPTPAMPEDCIIKNDSISSYHNYYLKNKQHLAEWKVREMPEWYILAA